jgi:hypothetical protein
MSKLGEHLAFSYQGRIQPGCHPAQVNKGTFVRSHRRLFERRVIAVEAPENFRPSLGSTCPRDLDAQTCRHKEGAMANGSQTLVGGINALL